MLIQGETPCDPKLAEEEDMVIPVIATRVLCRFECLDRKLVDSLVAWKGRQKGNIHAAAISMLVSAQAWI